MKNKLLYTISLVTVLASLVAGCSQLRSVTDTGGDSSQEASGVSSGSPSTSCNDSINYRSNGKNYRALSSAVGYKSNGRVEVYRNKTQGSLTTGCESFDLNGFTAAHRTLPLPTHIKITNKNNNKSVVVKVNDRGPVRGNSILQVTPAVANILGASSSFPAHIQAITTSGAISGLASSRSQIRARPARRRQSSNYLRAAKRPVDRSRSDRYYIVMGTYSSKDEALDRFVRLSSIGLSNAAMESRNVKGRAMHMVRLGPFYEQDAIDYAKDRLKNDGLIKFKVVKN